MSLIHLEILDPKRQEIFKLLAAFTRYGFLAGGTALALQICHRRSFDFDVFTYKEIDDEVLRAIKKTFKPVSFTLNTTDQVNFLTAGGIKMTFFFVEEENVFPLIKTEGISLADSKDIAANKAYTIGRRATWRDYVDIYFILQKKLATLEEIMNWSKKKFASGFVETQFLEQIVYFQDLEIAPVEYLHETPTPDQIKKFLEAQVREYLRSVYG